VIRKRGGGSKSGLISVFVNGARPQRGFSAFCDDIVAGPIAKRRTA